MRQIDNIKRNLRPFAWIIIPGLASWALFYWWIPTWAMWTLAIMLGAGVSIGLSHDLKRVCERRMAADEARRREELQAEIDQAGGIIAPEERPHGNG